MRTTALQPAVGSTCEMLARDAAILEDVQLAPLHEARRRSRDLLVRARRRTSRRPWPVPAGGSGARRRALAVGVVELLIGEGSDDDRQLDRVVRARSSPSRSSTRRRARAAGTSSARRRRGSRAASTRRPSRRRGTPRARARAAPRRAARSRRRREARSRLLRGPAEDARLRPRGIRSGDPCAAMLRAISSISPIQRQPLRRAERSAPASRCSSSGIESRHSASSASSTPSARASSRTVRSRAALPFVQPAYAAFSADAAPGSPEMTRASTFVPAKSAAISLRFAAGEIEARRARLVGRRPDDARRRRIARAGCDRPRGVGRDRVRVDVDPGEAARRPRDFDGGVRRADREQDLGAAAELCRGRRRPRVRPAPRARPSPGCGRPRPRGRSRRARAARRRPRRPSRPDGGCRRRSWPDSLQRLRGHLALAAVGRAGAAPRRAAASAPPRPRPASTRRSRRSARARPAGGRSSRP